MSRFQYVLTQTVNGVKTITLNRPDKRNALSPALIEELTLAPRRGGEVRLRRGDLDRRGSGHFAPGWTWSIWRP